MLFAGRHGDGVVNAHARSKTYQFLGDLETGGIAQIVRIRLKREAEQRNRASFQNEKLFLELLDHHLAL